MGYEQWIAIYIHNSSKSKTITPVLGLLKKGKLYDGWTSLENKNTELSQATVLTKQIGPGQCTLVGTFCGRENSPSGTKGELNLMCNDCKIASIEWNCPFTKNNSLRVIPGEHAYSGVSLSSPEVLPRGPIGLIVIRVDFEDENENITKPNTSTASHNDATDTILVVCALAEEASGFMQVLEKKGVKPVENQCEIHCNFKEYKVIIVWQPDSGEKNCTKLLDSCLQKIGKNKIKLLVMTGTCAGWPHKTKLGDIVVAEKVYDYSANAVEHSSSKTEFNVDTFKLDSEIKKWVVYRATEKKPKWLEYIPLSKPPTRTHIKEHTLHLLSEQSGEKDLSKIIAAIQKQFSENHHDLIKRVVKSEIQNLKNKEFLKETQYPSYCLTEKGIIYVKETRDKAEEFERDFPYTDPKRPRLIVGTLACGPSLRKDGELINKLRELAGQRNTVAIDMESIAIMNKAQDEKIRACVVKSVCNYGDEEKNDEFHEYATQTSAAFVLYLIENGPLDSEHKNFKTVFANWKS